ncbi:hypothetical protein [Streptomyces sp. NPDC017940]|uniref:hypothetical protein n=1 Tax=Streptomyces sp. NPDC017940 TaxID=3365017 RepID=UPI0037AA763D
MTASTAIRTIQRTLSDAARRLTTLDAEPTPVQDRLVWLHLRQRETVLTSLVAAAVSLSRAHATAGDAPAATAALELVEHYRHQLALARRDIRYYQPAHARLIQRAAQARHPDTGQSHD